MYDDVKVSVVMPVYNPGKYLETALESLINQSLKEIEIICINDASTDDSAQVLKKYADMDSRIKLMDNPYNLGAGPTRNIGLQIARGKYISFLDSDDLYNENLLERLYLQSEKYETDICVCQFVARNANTGKEWIGNDIKNTATKEILINSSFNVSTCPEDLLPLFSPNSFSRLYKKEFILDNGLMFQNLKNSNDLYFGMVTLALAKRITYVPEALITYNEGRAGQTSENRRKHIFCHFKALKKIYDRISKLLVWERCKNGFYRVALSCIRYQNTFCDKEAKGVLNSFYKTEGCRLLGIEIDSEYINNKSLDETFSFVDKKFLFSVIVAVYNTESYINECIESVINQDIGFEDNVQLILIDDGSTDSSLKICNEYARRYPHNISVIHQKNCGVSIARNKGIDLARGKYVNFLDSDDKITHTAFKKVANMFSEHEDVEFVTLPIFIFGRLNREDTYNNKFKKGTRVIDLSVEKNHVQASMSSSFVRREVLTDLRFDERLTSSEDGKLCTQILLRKKKMGVISTEKYFYRRREDAGSAVDSVHTKIELFPLWIKFFVYDLVIFCIEHNRGEIPAFAQNLMLRDLIGRYRPAIGLRKGDLGYQEGLKFLWLFYSVLKHININSIENSVVITEEEKKSLIRKMKSDVKSTANDFKNLDEGESFSEYILPFDLFQYQEKVVLYGDEKINKLFLRQNSICNLIDIVLLVDDSCIDVNKLLLTREYDSILITYTNIEKAKHAKGKMMEKGIDPVRIKWDDEMSNCKKFMHNHFNLIKRIDTFYRNKIERG